jgi:DNA replication protein
MTTGHTFSGFPESRDRLTPVPQAFFTELLPAIEDLAELKLTMLVLWLLGRKQGTYRWVTRDELAAEPSMVQALAGLGPSPAETLAAALGRAVARGTLLAAPSGDVYFLNSAKGRAAIAAIARGQWSPGQDDALAGPVPDRPNLFALYEQNIGPLTPMIAEHLREAEASYPSAWIEDALHIAVDNNVRKWSYVRAILEDWRARGKDDREDRGDSEKARRRYADSLDA